MVEDEEAARGKSPSVCLSSDDPTTEARTLRSGTKGPRAVTCTSIEVKDCSVVLTSGVVGNKYKKFGPGPKSAKEKRKRDAQASSPAEGGSGAEAD